MNSPAQSRSPPHTPLSAVTCYFNPARFKRRLENYRTFRRRLSVPLVTVELSFDGDFELKPDDAEILLQRHSADVMWQKERLLDLAVRAMPAECRYVVCLDCDVVFGSTDWAQRTIQELRRYPLVQPFSRLHHLPHNTPRAEPETCPIEFSQTSIAALAPFAFSPRDDVRQDEAGCLKWSSAKPELHAYVRSFFEHRLEDG